MGRVAFPEAGEYNYSMDTRPIKTYAPTTSAIIVIFNL